MGCIRLDILEKSFVPMQIVYKNDLGIDPLADQGGQQALSPYHAIGCNPALMVDPLGLQAQPLLHYAYGNNHTIVPPGYMMNGHYVYLSADRLSKAKNNFASYSLRAVTESFILKSQILNSILVGLGKGASIHNKGEGNYKFWFNAIGYNSGESGEWQNESGNAHEWKGAGFTLMLQSLMINVSEKNGTVYGSGVEYYAQGSGSFTGDPTYNNINTGLGAFGLGWSTKEIMMQGAVAEARGISIAQVNNISTIRAIGATGAGYMKVVKGVSTTATFLGGVLTVADGVVNGLQAHHVADLGIQAIIYGIGASVPVAGWLVGGAYFLGDLYFQSTHNGMSITQYYLDHRR